MSNLITAKTPNKWQDLEDYVCDILSECGLNAKKQVTLDLVRASAVVDVYATETHQGITTRLICECKNWKTKVPQNTVHSFRSVMDEAGANQGYIISRAGFQAGAIKSAHSTNITLVTFDEFQRLFFNKWLKARLWSIEHEIGDFNTYYEPFGIPGMGTLVDENERKQYHDVWKRYLPIGLVLTSFSPYGYTVDEDKPVPEVPFNFQKIDEQLAADSRLVPNDLREAAGYREFFQLITQYAKQGLAELQAHKPRPPKVTD